MDIYLLRHGVAVEPGEASYPNDDRPLTERGVKRLRDSFKALPLIMPKPGLILTSPLVRAKATADIAAAALKGAPKPRTTDFLLPHTPGHVLLKYLIQFKTRRCLLLVGHEPNLASLMALLLQVRDPVGQLKKGGICRISMEHLVSSSPGELRWLLTSKQLLLMAREH